MRTLITGGAGFVGSHLTEHLLASGDEVVVLDDMSTGSPRNLRAVAGHDRLTIVHGSVLNARTVREAMRGCDRVFHLAAAVGVKLIVEHPLQGLRTNIHGTENVLAAAVESEASVLLVSTSEIYGKNTADRLDEDADRILGSPLKSRWSYAAAKGIDEAFAKAYADEEGLEVSIVRLFNTIGPRQTGRYGMVVPNLVGQALRGDPLSVFGDGMQTRCFSAVGDVVPAMVAIERDPRSRGQAYNLGGAREIAIVELAREIIEIVESTSTIEFIPYERAYSAGFEDMRRRVPDNSRAHDLVGYHPHTSLGTSILLVAADLVTRDRISDELMPLARAGGVGTSD
ncbi:NAD-dependent epimerase/dehydratase family protein [Microbacterium hatanonis]|uniref:NAD-dependent epimerase/dehydratase family protein n=1 Tax=Microbacterium hatanonis TaxID=404366 RepID=A0A5C8I344_9MICO|nr:NAD-dependent epimerase/dehydratase family protein [Microbacterium hatanonis]TXK13186.1 NAD-dependent epimerase/dehydratase family protein [Microbacterium hatanonis]